MLQKYAFFVALASEMFGNAFLFAERIDILATFSFHLVLGVVFQESIDLSSASSSFSQDPMLPRKQFAHPSSVS